MASKELICENCVSVCNVPKSFSKESLLQLVNSRGLRGHILGIHTVPGIENDRNLTRWIVWLESPEDVRNFLEKKKGNRVEFEGHMYTVTYERTNPCDIPDSWLQKYGAGRGHQHVYTGQIPQETVGIPERRKPPLPPEGSQQQAAYNRQPHAGKQNISNPQHQYLVSGYYQNLPPDAQVEQKKKDRESSQQLMSHDHLPRGHQMPSQEYHYDLGHRHVHGQGGYNVPVAGQEHFFGQYPGGVQQQGLMPCQDQAQQESRIPGQGHAPQHGFIHGHDQTPQQGPLTGQGQALQHDLMHGQGQAQQLGRLGQGQIHKHVGIHSPGQPTQQGLMPGHGQAPKQDAMPGRGHTQEQGGVLSSVQPPHHGPVPSQRQTHQQDALHGQGQATKQVGMTAQSQAPHLMSAQGLVPQQDGMPRQRTDPQQESRHVYSQQQGGMSGQGQAPQLGGLHLQQQGGITGQGQAPQQDGLHHQQQGGLTGRQAPQQDGQHGQQQGGVTGQGQDLQQGGLHGQQEGGLTGQGQAPQQGGLHGQQQVGMSGQGQAQMYPNIPFSQNQGSNQNIPPYGMFPMGMPPNFNPYQANNSDKNIPFPSGMMPYMIDPQTGQFLQFPGYPNLPAQQAGTPGRQEHGPLQDRPPYNTRNVEDDRTNIPRTDIREEESCGEEYNHSQGEPTQEPVERPTKIIVSNIPSSAHGEYLEMYFENTKKFGGGPVKRVELDEDEKSAVIEFEDPDAVDVVMSKCPLMMMNQSVEIEVYVPEPPAPLCTIQVKGPRDIIKQTETMELYFENEKKSNGGNVEDVRYDSEEELVYVTFETEEIAQRVVEKTDHHMNRKRLSVQLFKPVNRTKKFKKNENDYDEEAEETEETEEIKESECSVKVKGVKNLHTRDTLEFYFENKRRSGGGEFESIMTDEEDDDVVYIKFKNEEVAKAVANKSHKLEGCELQVSLYVPPKPLPSYDNKVLIKGLNPQTTQDCLFNFIEAKSDFVPESMVYHSQDEGVVMVTMESNSEFKYEKLEKIFAGAKLEGNALKLARVPISNCIMVSNLADDVTKDTLEFYFENKRKSGGGSVSKVVMNDDSTSFVYFEDYKIIDGVLDRQHTLSGETLLVQRYQECLGRPEGDVSERKLNVPDPLVLRDVASQKIKFMKNSKVNRETLGQQLKTIHTNIIWPKESSDVVLECTLTKEDSDCFKLVKSWKTDAQKNFEDFMKNIVVHKVDVLQDLWQKVMEQLKNINVSKPEAAAVFVEKNDGMITVVGNVPVVDPLAKQLLAIRKQAMDELEKERQTVKEVVTSLKPIETKMLLADKYPNKMEDMFDGLKVKININRKEIVFEGSSSNVQSAKLKMYEMKNSFEYETFGNISKLKQTLYQSKATKEYIVKKLKNKHVTAAWEVQQSGTLIVCTKRDNTKYSTAVICESVTENCIALRNASKPVMNSEQWSSKLNELHGFYQGKCEIDVSEDIAQVYICATDDILDEIVDSVKAFLRLNTVLVEKVPCTKIAHRLIERHHKEALTRIPKDLQSSYVQVTSLPNYGGFEVRGTEDGIIIAKQGLKDLLNKIRKREHTLDKPGLSDHMDTPKGKDSLNTIESTLPCVVTVKGDEAEAQSDWNLYDTGPTDSGVSKNVGVKGLNIVASCKFAKWRCVHIAQGDMTELSVGVLVNPADDKLSLTGGLGKAIVSKGGQKIGRECRAYIQSESRLANGRAFLSTAGNLKANFIAHVRGPLWKQGNDNEEEKLQEAVSICLQETSAKNVVSMAIPAISCGNYGYPVKHATSTIVKAIKNFFRKEQDSSVKDVYLCDVKQNTVECFTDAAGREFGQQNVQRYSQAHDSKTGHRPSAYSQQSSSDDEIEPMDTDEENDGEYYSRPNILRRKPPPGVVKVLHEPPPLPKPRTTQQEQQSEVKLGNISVLVVKGEISKHKVDLIVNTTGKNLDLKNGAVSASLLKAGGPALQKEVSTKYPDGIKDGELAITSGQKLQCSTVIHTSVAKWDANNADSCTTALHKLMKDCMDQAEAQNLTSIAFPAIGTGNLGFPRDVVAAEMFNAVGKFSAKSLREVRFILYQKDNLTIQAFESEFGRCRKSNARQSRKYDPYEDFHKSRAFSSDEDSDDSWKM